MVKQVKKMMIERIIGSYRFQGFYESIYSNSDEFMDDEQETSEEYGLNYEDVNYEYTDFNRYKEDVSQKFLEKYIETIKEELPYNITMDEQFLFKMIEDTTFVVSPRYYNYETDRCYCKIQTNNETLTMIKDYTLGLDGAEEYILNNFTSRDGYHSFITNDIRRWKELPAEDYEENMLICLLDMLLSLSYEGNVFNDIGYEVLDEICKYEYAICYVNQEGKSIPLTEYLKNTQYW